MFILSCSILLRIHVIYVFTLLLIDLVFQYRAKRLAGKNVSENDLFCVGWGIKLYQSVLSMQVAAWLQLALRAVCGVDYCDSGDRARCGCGHGRSTTCSSCLRSGTHGASASAIAEERCRTEGCRNIPVTARGFCLPCCVSRTNQHQVDLPVSPTTAAIRRRHSGKHG